MFKGDWHRFIALWLTLITLILFLSGWLLWDLSASQTEQRIRGEQATERHISYAEDRIDEKCLSLEGVVLRDCIQQEIEAARDHSRSEQDLDAQQTMAFFTKIMGATALLGVALGLGSVILIYLTLSETQQMAIDQRRIGEAGLRAYIDVSVDMATNMDAAGAPTIAKYSFRNIGKTPAFPKIIEYKLYRMLSSDDIDGDKMEFEEPQNQKTREFLDGVDKMLEPDHIMLPGDEHKTVMTFSHDQEILGKMIARREDFFLEIVVEYKDVFGRDHSVGSASRYRVEKAKDKTLFVVCCGFLAASERRGEKEKAST